MPDGCVLQLRQPGRERPRSRSPGSPLSRECRRMAWVLSGLRMFMGVLWLANLSWKLPPDFGRDQPRGLVYSFHQAEHHAIVDPLRQLMRQVVIPHFTVFGWQV